MKIKTWILAFGLVLATSAAIFFNAPKPAFARSQELDEGAIALVGARVYVSPLQVIGNGVVIIRDGKIAAVGSRSQVHVPQGVGIVDCGGMSIMAGFQNSHVHFTEPKWNDAAKLPGDELTQQLADMFTRYGFTSVVDTGSNLENTKALRQRVDSGELLGPRILTAGTPLYPPDGVPYYVKSTLPPDILKRLPQPATAADAVKQVDEHVAQGADVIKLFTGSWVARGQVVTMPVEVAKAAADEAHKKGKLVFAHPSNVAGFQIALEANVDVLAHAVEDLHGWNRSYTTRMKQQGMWMIPTLKLFMKDSNLKDILNEVQDFSAAKGPILFGTDVGFLEDYDPAVEYSLMKRSGMDFPQILESLTSAPARRFGESNIRGQVKPGLNADLVVVAGDPQDDIRALTRVNYTFRDGRIIYPVPEP
ncbi:MAG TPA: amidohydrolase family protein [Candidatus Acidoferrales bacterium]|nr:amidohydrolase family protein [Candidatus Acidoferrales bacterium]